MKAKLLLFFLVIAINLPAQILERSILISGGSYFIFSGGINIESTLGETVIHTIRSGNTTYTQGFLQPEQFIRIPAGRGTGPISDFTVYPNPTTDQVKVNFTLIKPALVKLTLRNKSGKIVNTAVQFCSSGVQEITYNLQVVSGLYFLELSYTGYSIVTKVIVE